MAETWHTSSGAEPLQIRWDEAAAAMIKRGHQPITPCTESSVFRMRNWLQGQQPPQPAEPPSPMLNAATDSFMRACEAYERVRAVIVDRQKDLRRASRDAHRILGDLPDTLLTPPLRTEEMLINLGVTRDLPARYRIPAGWVVPAFPSAEAARLACTRVMHETLKIEGVQSAIAGVFDFETASPDQQNRQLIFSVAARLGALEDRLSALEERNERTTAKRSRK